MIRKALGIKKMPKLIPGLRRIVYKDNVAIYPIGIKEDKITESCEQI